MIAAPLAVRVTVVADAHAEVGAEGAVVVVLAALERRFAGAQLADVIALATSGADDGGALTAVVVVVAALRLIHRVLHSAREIGAARVAFAREDHCAEPRRRVGVRILL